MRKREVDNSNIFTIEAIRNDNMKLLVPNLHIIIRKVDENSDLWIGKCLDLNICAYSRKASKQEICREIFDSITKMALIKLIAHLENGSEEALLTSIETTNKDWADFNSYNNIQKIKELKDSYFNNTEAIKTIKDSNYYSDLEERTVQFIVQNLLLFKIYKLREVHTEVA